LAGFRHLILLAGAGIIGFFVTGVFLFAIGLIFAYWREGVHARIYYEVMVFLSCAGSFFIVWQLGWDDAPSNMRSVYIAFCIGGMIAIASVLWDVIPISKIFSRNRNQSGQ